MRSLRFILPCLLLVLSGCGDSPETPPTTNTAPDASVSSAQGQPVSTGQADIERLAAENQWLREQLEQLKTEAETHVASVAANTSPADPAVTGTKFKEAWRVDYDNGYSRIYYFQGDGTLLHYERIQAARLSKQNDRFIINFDNEPDRIECVTRDSSDNTVIHHFNPKELLDEGAKPSTTGTVSRVPW